MGIIVEVIHDFILDPGELPGRARDRSLDGALAQVENRVAYGIEDMFDLAALYAMAVAQGHCFNDGNKRTGYRVMQLILEMHGTGRPLVLADVLGQRIIALAQGLTDEVALVDWLRENAS